MNFRTLPMFYERPLAPLETRKWKPRPVGLMIDGEDVTHLVPGGEMSGAMSLMASHLAAPPPDRPVDSGPKTIAQGVRVRSQIVMRN